MYNSGDEIKSKIEGLALRNEREFTRAAILHVRGGVV